MSATSLPGTRERWRMGIEARALLLVTAVLVAFGLAVLYSASALVAGEEGRPGHHYVLRQATGVLAGMVCFAIAAKLDAEIWRRFAWPIMGISLLLMLVVILPGSSSIYGSRRYLFGGSIQPSELAKFAILVWTPMLLIKKGDAVRRLGKGLMPFIVVIGALTLLAILEPDYSVAMLFCLLMAVLLFVGGARVAHFVFLGALAVPLLAQQLASRPYVRERLRSFLAHEESDSTRKSPTAVQQYQSLMAVGSGGALGVGFGQGNQQRGWLPLAYNDFVGSVVGEEFGFVGIAGLTLAFALYGWLGFRIARSARSPYCALLAVGLTFATVFTAFIHVGVVIGLLPNTGLTLPFVSYGRSNLVLTLAMTGILVNIGSEKERVYGVSATDPWFRSRRDAGFQVNAPASRRVWFAGGGTGGHLYPGLAIARALVQRDPSFKPFFVGARRGIERDVLPGTEFPHALLDLHPLYRRAPWNNWRTMVGAIGAWRELSRLAAAERPAAVVGTGGYAAGVALAWARAHGVPTVLHEPDSHPGLTTRAFARGARAIYLGFAEATRFLSTAAGADVRALGAPIETPPVARLSRADARAAWGLPPDAFVVLVFGGSQGAKALNDAIAAWCALGLPQDVALIWATGRAQAAAYQQNESPMVRVRPYLSPIGDAYAAADVAVTRAGAMSIAELCAWSIPSVLVPLPTAAQDHQAHNASAVAASGAAIHLPQAQLSAERLASIVNDLRVQPDRLHAMRRAARERAKPNAAADIAGALAELLAPR